MKEYSVAIFGAGIIGSNIFSSLVLSGVKCVLVEKENDVSLGATKANSGIIHAGYDAQTGTLKAKYNVRGNKMYEKLAKRLGEKIISCGSFVVGREEDLPALQVLLERGKNNGVKNLEILDSTTLHKMEPNLRKDIKYALFSKDAKIISPYHFCISLVNEGVINGGDLLLNFNTTKIERIGEKYVVLSSDGRSFEADFIINCAGAGVNEIGTLIGEEKIDISFKKGEYILLDNSEAGLVSRPIFPLPTKHGKGILACPTVHQNIFFGPTAVDEKEYNTAFSYSSLNSIKEKVTNMVDHINFRKTIKLYAGVRVISGDDFVVSFNNKNPNYIVLAGICSPGLSSAPAIAEDVTNYILKQNVKVRKFTPKTLKVVLHIVDLNLKEQNALILKNKAYGEIVCNCEKVTKGEILDVLKSTPYRLTTDGLKRRLRTTMGHCGGSFCYPKIVKIMADYYKVPEEEIDFKGFSSVVSGDIKEGGIYE